jgi:hypothetical protein
MFRFYKSFILGITLFDFRKSIFVNQKNFIKNFFFGLISVNPYLIEYSIKFYWVRTEILNIYNGGKLMKQLIHADFFNAQTNKTHSNCYIIFVILFLIFIKYNSFHPRSSLKFYSVCLLKKFS